MVRACVVVLLCVCLNVCAALICPDGGICEDGDTCCQTPSGGYGCCPLPNAECCSDHLHCCFEGTLCDLQHSKCVNKTHVLDWVERVATKQQAVVCPDKVSECPDDTTCCQMPDGSWGCCPMKNAVCCADKQHCCPQGTTCDIEHSMCLSATYGPSLLWRKFAARRRRPSENKAVHVPAEPRDIKDVVCPDKISSCPDDTTCCQLGNGSYGCCPMPKAVCCSDHLHCCPEGTTCDLPHSTCVSANGVTAMAAKIPALTSLGSRENAVPCNKTVACASGTTCCKTLEGAWACCPLPKAVCCEDHAHCCPHDTVCNLAEGTCNDPADLSVPVPWVEKVPTFSIASQLPNQKCDETSTCPGDATCCRLESGEWGCCPLPQAVCCEDHLHCCPHDTVCNLAASTCDSGSDQGVRTSVPLVRKIATVTPSPNQNCDKSSLCPTGSTCCRLKSGAWACCPLPQAVCCADGEHCCPQGHKCDVTRGTCERPGLPSMPWFRKQPALGVTRQSGVDVGVPDDRHMCDDHTSCPRDDTCCYMNKLGKWGCCPLPKAVCCKDGDHCCPSGYKCDEGKTSCIKAYHEIPWFRKREAKVTEGSEVVLGDEDVKCDSTTSCASGSTCCKLSTGNWGCCPLVKAVCCEDGEHCCPQGYTCDLQFGSCIKPFSAHSVPLTQTQSQEEVMCDASTRCSKTQTCCRLADSTWACCPNKEAVCCKDMKHCCPMGYKCDTQVKGCTKESIYNWWENALK